MKEYHFEEDYNDILNTFWGLQIEREYLELPYDICIDYRGIDCSRTFRVPLVRVYLEELEKLVPVTISDSPKILTCTDFDYSEQILNWVREHYDALIKLWKHEYKNSNERRVLFYSLFTEKGLEQYRDFFQAFEDNAEYDDSYGGVEDTFEWLIIAENYTALPYEIWLDCVGCDRGSDSIPEIRVHIKEQELLVPVYIGEAPTVLMDKQFEHSELVLDWVKKNSEKLLRIWNHDYPDLAEEGEVKMSFVRHV